MITGDAYDDWLGQIIDAYGDLKPSMLQDFEHGREPEIDFINGHVARPFLNQRTCERLCAGPPPSRILMISIKSVLWQRKNAIDTVRSNVEMTTMSQAKAIHQDFRLLVGADSSATLSERGLRRLELAAGQCWADSRGPRIHVSCVDGCVWATEQGNWRDILLKPGERWTSSGQGTVVLQGLPTAIAEICILPRRRRNWLERLAASTKQKWAKIKGLACRPQIRSWPFSDRRKNASTDTSGTALLRT